MEPTVQGQESAAAAQSVQTEAKEQPVRLARVYAIVILGMVIGSFTTTLTKVAMNMGVNGTAVTFYRMAIVVVCLAPICFFNPKYNVMLSSPTGSLSERTLRTAAIASTASATSSPARPASSSHPRVRGRVRAPVPPSP